MCDATLLCDNAYQCSATQGNLYIASSIYNRPMVTTKLRDKLSSLDAERDALTQRLDAEVDYIYSCFSSQTPQSRPTDDGLFQGIDRRRCHGY